MRKERHLTLYDSRDHISERMAMERLEWARKFREKALPLLDIEKTS